MFYLLMTDEKVNIQLYTNPNEYTSMSEDEHMNTHIISSNRRTTAQACQDRNVTDGDRCPHVAVRLPSVQNMNSVDVRY